MTLVALYLGFCFVLLQSIPLTTAGNVSGINGDGIEEAAVGEDEEEEEDRIQYKDTNRWARARSVEGGKRSEKVIDCCSSAWISRASLKSLTT